MKGVMENRAGTTEKETPSKEELRPFGTSVGPGQALFLSVLVVSGAVAAAALEA